MSKLVLIALLLAPVAARAGAYAIPHENARSLGLAQADVAAQTGPEAAYQNASALAGQQGLAISASLEMLYNITTWTAPDSSAKATLRPKANLPPQLAVAYGDKLPNDMAWGAGIAFLLPGGGSLLWPFNWQGAARIQDVDQKVFLIQTSAGLQPVSFFKIGASLLYYRVTETLSQQLNFIDTTGNASLGLSGGGLAFGLSGEIRPPGVPLTIGIDYRHQAPMTLSGSAHFVGVPPSFAAALQDQAVTEAVTVPNLLFLGAAYDVMPDLKVMATFTLERWINYTSDTFVGAKGLVISVPRDYRNAQVYRVAGEYSHVPFLPQLTLRLGLLRSYSNVRSDTISPSLSDGDSWAISVGAGYDLPVKGMRIDLGYQFALFDTATASGAEAFPGSYDTHAHLLSLGLNWRPGF
jgi:long-subunit fatty acid transport protein